jgi:Zn-dependent protease with chaperone function
MLLVTTIEELDMSRGCERNSWSVVRPALVVMLCATVAGAQTRITPPKNKFTPEQDVQLGREAAAEVRREYPLINDRQIDAYLDELGRRLVAAAPAELKQRVFEYSFTPVNLKDINAFALPGGPMFVNRGMFDAATTEGEVVGVMAHELSHVLLRHGTANATKAEGFQLGALAGAIAGAVIGGGVGQVISQGSQFGLGTWFLKYSRDYEKQADLLGSQIMARAGYDPRDLARMFETIQKEGNGAPPQWLSSHPNPGNRTQYIAEEAAQLQIAGRPDQSGFQSVKRRFASLPAAKSMADIARSGGEGGRGEETIAVGRIGEPVPAPASQSRQVRGGQLFEAAVPQNWTAVPSNASVKYVPQNGYGEHQGQTVLTHGVELGVAPASSRDLREATGTLVSSFLQGNPGMRAGETTAIRISGRPGLATPLAGRSAVGGEERVGLYTTLLGDGNLFYYVTVVPEREASRYRAAFDRVGQSIRLNDR